MCAPWQTAATPLTVPVEAGESELPDAPPLDGGTDATLEDSGPDASLEDADAPDAGPPTTWQLPAEYASLAVGTSGLFVASGTVLQRYPREPGPSAFQLAERPYQVLVNLGLPGAEDVLYGYSNDQLYHLDPSTLVGTHIDPCATSDCTEITGTSVFSDSYRRIVRNGDVLFFATNEYLMGPSLQRVHRMLLDGTNVARVYDGVPADQGTLRVLYPWNAGALVGVRLNSSMDLDSYRDCTYAACGFGSVSFTRVDEPGVLDRLAIYPGGVPFENGSLFAYAGWEDIYGGTGGQGLVHLAGNSLRRIADSGAMRGLARRGDVACYVVADGGIGCLRSTGGTIQPIPGASTTRDLLSDGEWVYWVEKDTTVLHRTSWVSATPPDAGP